MKMFIERVMSPEDRRALLSHQLSAARDVWKQMKEELSQDSNQYAEVETKLKLACSHLQLLLGGCEDVAELKPAAQSLKKASGILMFTLQSGGKMADVADCLSTALDKLVEESPLIRELTNLTQKALHAIGNAESAIQVMLQILSGATDALDALEASVEQGKLSEQVQGWSLEAVLKECRNLTSSLKEVLKQFDLNGAFDNLWSDAASDHNADIAVQIQQFQVKLPKMSFESMAGVLDQLSELRFHVSEQASAESRLPCNSKDEDDAGLPSRNLN